MKISKGSQQTKTKMNKHDETWNKFNLPKSSHDIMDQWKLKLFDKTLQQEQQLKPTIV